MSPRIHPTAEVLSTQIGESTTIWQFVVVLAKARIGCDCNICSHVFIEDDVVIGDRVTIKNGVQLWNGLRVEDDVFIGPNVTFTNDKFPRSKVYPSAFLQTIIQEGASIGGGGDFAGCYHWQEGDGRGRICGHPIRSCRGHRCRQPGTDCWLCGAGV
ncbi:tlr1342 [Thermosynechococcus vestitus BP-1]|uniref:Tlr1342 protein n=1 Tax=Thermosynechococcus vestitus (strain NIES-2133 / IAM M-273 / BP-1) TaxID=197221 RepID=Q8DJ86_THEVB|nr:tlr1342 [Thermosynechococcus vestitus BP-1]